MSTDITQFMALPTDGATLADIQRIDDDNAAQDTELAFLNDQPAQKTFTTAGTALTADGTLQLLPNDNVPYTHPLFTNVGGVLTYTGAPEKFHIDWAFVYEPTVIPLFQEITSCIASITQNGTELHSLAAQETAITDVTKVVSLSGSFDLMLNTNDTLIMGYVMLVSDPTVLVQTLNQLGFGVLNQQTTHLSIHMI